jgi:hypothetical protein
MSMIRIMVTVSLTRFATLASEIMRMNQSRHAQEKTNRNTVIYAI